MGTSVPRAQLHLKGKAPALAIEDTQAGGHQYMLRSRESADGSLGLFDETTAKARWVVDGEGRLGINTTKPTSTLTVDGYIESTKGFLVNGRPVGGFGLLGSVQPLSTEGSTNNFFGTGAGSVNTGTLNSFFGSYAGHANTSGHHNSFFGGGSAYWNTTGFYNSFFGETAGFHNTTGYNNAFFGRAAGNANTTGFGNSFFGLEAGYANTTGSHNSFFGEYAGCSNTTGYFNSFFGREAAYWNTTGYYNSFFGESAGHANSTGFYNSFFGGNAGYANTTGSNNSFFGNDAGAANTTGYLNSFFGRNAGHANSTGFYNSFLGNGAGYANATGSNNSFFGNNAGAANTTGNLNSFLGSSAGAHNTVENSNTFVGSFSDLDPGSNPDLNPVTNAAAIGYGAFVSRANSLVLGGVKGFNGVAAETFVGIGTPSPDRQLVVEGSQALGKFRRYNATGPDFGPAFLFERARGSNTAAQDILPGDYLGKVQFRGRVAGNMPEYGALTFIASDTSQNGRFSFVDRDLVTERMVILNTGNVGIGTTAPTERLDVAGNLRVRGGIVYGAPEVRVPDYVFEPDYTLMPLEELRQFVKNEKHLPNVPNAGEIQNNGVNLGEFQMKLLAKVEELTLYALQQEQADNYLREEAAAQKEEAAGLKERIKALEEMVRALVERDKGGR